VSRNPPPTAVNGATRTSPKLPTRGVGESSAEMYTMFRTFGTGHPWAMRYEHRGIAARVGEQKVVVMVPRTWRAHGGP